MLLILGFDAPGKSFLVTTGTLGENKNPDNLKTHNKRFKY